jgi:hypothetical protein
MSFQPIKRLIPHSLEKAGWKDRIDAMSVIETAVRVLNGLWGAEKASRIEFISLKDGALKGHSNSGVAIQELNVIKTQFINEINRALGERKVTALKLGRF